MPESDAALVARIRAGSESSFAVIVRRYEAQIHGLARKFASCRDDAEDIVQQTFISAYYGLAGFRGESSFQTWLYRIAKNTALMQTRAAARRGPGHATESATAADAESELDLRRFVHVAVEALARLEEAQRAAFVLCELESLPTSEVARALRTSPVAVRQRTYRARRALRRFLSLAGVPQLAG